MNKRELYKTAVATIACREFPAGARVAVEYSHQNANGVHWWNITKSQYGTLESPVSYPEHHLSNFVL